jgi:hypothetical protein
VLSSTPHYSSLSLFRLNVQLPADQLVHFFPLFQRGITLPVTVGCSLKSLLCDQLAIPEAYVTERVTTVFCDNCPVDDLELTMIHTGSRIALSAAMPGLVGATMRRGGFYAALRQGISHVIHTGSVTPGNGTVTIKLFNLLMTELGPTLLAHGIQLEPNDAHELLPDMPALSDASSIGTGQVLLAVSFKE